MDFLASEYITEMSVGLSAALPLIMYAYDPYNVRIIR